MAGMVFRQFLVAQLYGH